MAERAAIRIGAVRVCLARLTGREKFASDDGDYYHKSYPNDLAIRGLLNQLFRRELPYNEADLLDIVRPLAEAIDGGRDRWNTIYGVPVYGCVRAVQRAMGHAPIYPTVAEELRRFREPLADRDLYGFGDWVRALSVIGDLLDGPKVLAAEEISPIEPIDDWGIFVCERQTGDYSQRFANHILRQHQFQALCRQRGWTYHLQGLHFDGYNRPTLELDRVGYRAEFWVEPIEEGGESGAGIALYVSTDQVRIYRIGEPPQASTRGVYLPFEGDAMLSIILSKALLLADDKRIKDRSIRRQIDGAAP